MCRRRRPCNCRLAKLFAQDDELYVLARSEGRQAEERAIRHKKLARLLGKLHVMRLHPPSRDQLLLRIGAARKDADRAAKFVTLKFPPEEVRLTPPLLLSTSPLYRKT